MTKPLTLSRQILASCRKSLEHPSAVCCISGIALGHGTREERGMGEQPIPLLGHGIHRGYALKAVVAY